MTLTYHDKNAMVNVFDEDGKMQLHMDQGAVEDYFEEHVKPRLRVFPSVEDQITQLTNEGYYETSILDQYVMQDIERVFERARSYNHTFKSFMGILKFYRSYSLQSNDGTQYLETFTDRVTLCALYLARGDVSEAMSLVDEMMSGRLQLATPTFLNSARAQRGELVSCYVDDVTDSMEGISRAITAALQLSKRGGGVSLCMTNIRESGAPIKGVEGRSSGPLPIMKILENVFQFSNQLGQRQGAGAVWVNVFHPDTQDILDSKKENADDARRIKTLSVGVVIPDVVFEKARANEDFWQVSPYDVERYYGIPMAYVNMSEEYDNILSNPDIRKRRKVNARSFLQDIAHTQAESGYPYIMMEDNVNRGHQVAGKVILSNLCSETAMLNTPSAFNEDSSFSEVGLGAQCNLGSLNIANVMESPDVGSTISTAVRALSAVSDMSNLASVPSIAEGNRRSRAIGLGQMNLHGYFASVGLEYGSPESVAFTDAYFRMVLYHTLSASMRLAKEHNPFYGFEKSRYASGEFFDDLIGENWVLDPSIAHLFEGIDLPNDEDWIHLKDDVMEHGLYSAYLQAVPPTGSISYLNHATASIHPVTAPVEIRKEGKLGRVYYPAPGLTEDNMHLFRDAYEIGPEKIIDIYAAAQKYVDQSLSLTLFFKDSATTRDLNRAQIYAWRKGIKTLYYVRLRQMALSGTEVEGCVSCAL